MLTPPFATSADLIARWRPLTPTEETRADALLEDASQMILDEDRRRVLADLTEVTPSLVRVVCKMVQRAMTAPVDAQPVSQLSQSMGPFAESATYVNPAGDMYLTKAERRQLGLRVARAGSAPMWVEPA